MQKRFFTETNYEHTVNVAYYKEDNDYEYNLEFSILSQQNQRRLKKGDRFKLEFSANFSNINVTLENPWISIISPWPNWKKYSDGAYGDSVELNNKDGQIKFTATFTLNQDVSVQEFENNVPIALRITFHGKTGVNDKEGEEGNGEKTCSVINLKLTSDNVKIELVDDN